LLKKEFLSKELFLRVQERFKLILKLSTLKVLLLVSASNRLRFLKGNLALVFTLQVIHGIGKISGHDNFPYNAS